jgi:hypothetical protein
MGLEVGTFAWAVKMMEEGKRVWRPDSDPIFILQTSAPYDGTIMTLGCHGRNQATFTIDDFTASDWELAE